MSNQQAAVSIELADESLKKFNSALDRYLSSVNVNVPKTVKKLAGAILKDITLLTPVDTGRVRAGWHAGFRALGAKPPGMPRATLDVNSEGETIVKKTTARDIAEGEAAGRARVTEKPGEIEVYVRNGVRYAPFLEAGGSSQAPRGMVRVTLDRYRTLLDENMRKIEVQGAK